MGKKQNLVSLKEAVKMLNEAHCNNPEVTKRNVLSVRALYNLLSAKKIGKYGPRHMRQVDMDELLAKYGPKKSA